VSSSKLGSINHTLLSIETCFVHGINLHALLYNRLPDNNAIIADDTIKMIKKTLQVNYPHTKVAEISNEGVDEDFSIVFNGVRHNKSIQ